MYKTRQTELPARIRILRRLRGLLAAAACLAVFSGLLASIDAISERFFAPEGVTSALPAKTFPLSGALPLHTQLTAPKLLAKLEPNTALVLVEHLDVHESFFGSAPQWHTILQILPPASPGVYQLTLTLADEGWALPLGTTRIDLFASEEALEQNSRSLLLKYIGISPIDASLWLLAFAILFGLLYFACRRYVAAAFAERGYLRVYHTKDAGDDTLLYCADPKKVLELERTYPVLSAAGQYLGTADVSEAGGRYCVLRLYAARARAGCFVSLGMTYETRGLNVSAKAV